MIFFEGNYLSARITAVAQATKFDENKPLPHDLKWRPFGGGPHACLGRALAENEFKVLFNDLKEGYKFTLKPKLGVPKRIALVTLQLDKDIYINIEKKGD